MIYHRIAKNAFNEILSDLRLPVEHQLPPEKHKLASSKNERDDQTFTADAILLHNHVCSQLPMIPKNPTDEFFTALTEDIICALSFATEKKERGCDRSVILGIFMSLNLLLRIMYVYKVMGLNDDKLENAKACIDNISSFLAESATQHQFIFEHNTETTIVSSLLAILKLQDNLVNNKKKLSDSIENLIISPKKKSTRRRLHPDPDANEGPRAKAPRTDLLQTPAQARNDNDISEPLTPEAIFAQHGARLLLEAAAAGASAATAAAAPAHPTPPPPVALLAHQLTTTIPSGGRYTIYPIPSEPGTYCLRLAGSDLLLFFRPTRQGEPTGTFVTASRPTHQ